MEVICIEDQAFYKLIDQIILYVQNKQNDELEWKWIDTETCMNLLKIKSKTTLQKLRDGGKIRFTQPNPKLILYDKDSINEFLENNAHETF